MNVDVFIDDHSKELTIGYDETKSILNNIYEKSLRNIINSTQLDVQTNITFYILGLADEKSAKNAYLDYAGEQAIHPRMQLSRATEEIFNIFQFGAAPWMPIYEQTERKKTTF